MTQQLAQALAGQSFGPRGSQGPQPGGGWEGWVESISDMLMMPEEDQAALADIQDKDPRIAENFANQQDMEDQIRILGPMMEMGGIFAGRLARTANKRALGKAMTMQGRGASRDEIYRDTGWWQGPDEKWRFEIDDSTMTVDLPRGQGRGRGVAGEHSAIQHPELAEAYPEMQQTINHALEMRGSGGSFQEGARRGPHTDPARLFANGGNPDAVRSTTLHELQHATQGREGFARGGSPEEFSQDALTHSPNESYRHLGGEVESRNVQARRDFTPEQRAATPPWTTQDIEDLAQILRSR